MDIVPFPLIEIAGPPRERGRAYGEQARERVHRSAALYRERLGQMALGPAQVEALVDSLLPRMQAFDGDYIEEMRGIAEGAAIDFPSIALINARTEVLELAKRAVEARGEPDGCTGAVILPARCAAGRLIHVQNWDWRAECVETSVVLRADYGDGTPAFLTFTEAGGLARHGFNAVGVSITANYLECERDYRQPGVPLALIRRKVLEQRHFALAVRIVATTPKAASNNMVLAWHEGFAVSCECAPDETFMVYPQDDLLVHANHWISPAALAKLKDTGLDDTPDSVYRDWRVRRLLEAHGRILDREAAKAALFDDFATPYSVCRPPRPSQSGNLVATVAMIAMEPAAGLMEVAPLPAVSKTFTTYRLPPSTEFREAAQ